jgi:hypothetical protein
VWDRGLTEDQTARNGTGAAVFGFEEGGRSAHLCMSFLILCKYGNASTATPLPLKYGMPTFVPRQALPTSSRMTRRPMAASAVRHALVRHPAVDMTLHVCFNVSPHLTYVGIRARQAHGG